MAVKIVTDSTADLPSELVSELGITVVHSTTPERTDSLSERIGSSLLDRRRVHLARLGPALRIHGGPETLAVALMGNTGARRAPGG